MWSESAAKTPVIRAKFLSPWLTDDQTAKLARTPAALVVVAAPGGGSVQPGDLILSIDGQPALPQVLARKRLAGVPVEVRVGRGGNERDAANVRNQTVEFLPIEV